MKFVFFGNDIASGPSFLTTLPIRIVSDAKVCALLGGESADKFGPLKNWFGKSVSDQLVCGLAFR